MSRVFRWLGIVAFFACCAACNNDQGDKGSEQGSNDLVISCDETFKPVIDAQLQVFTDAFPGTKVRVYYKAEAECLKDLFVDSVKMVIIAKMLTEPERNYIVDSLKVGVEQAIVAYDAIAVVVHPLAPDSMFTMQEIKNILDGNAKKNLIPVFDGLTATSTVRFMIDTVLAGGKLGPNVTAAKGSRAVIESVMNNPAAIGFVGVSWLGNRDDTAQTALLKKVKLAYLESKDSAGAYVKPLQYHLYTGSYPMVRDLVYVLKEKDPYGAGHHFANFMENQRGQLLFRRSYLAPAIMPSVFRPAETADMSGE